MLYAGVSNVAGPTQVARWHEAARLYSTALPGIQTYPAMKNKRNQKVAGDSLSPKKQIRNRLRHAHCRLPSLGVICESQTQTACAVDAPTGGPSERTRSWPAYYVEHCQLSAACVCTMRRFACAPLR